MNEMTAENSGAIEVINDKEATKFLINLIPHSQYNHLINSPYSNIVEGAGLNWCPFCGISLEE